jgi:hypothetical protein
MALAEVYILTCFLKVLLLGITFGIRFGSGSGNTQKPAARAERN